MRRQRATAATSLIMFYTAMVSISPIDYHPVSSVPRYTAYDAETGIQNNDYSRAEATTAGKEASRMRYLFDGVNINTGTERA